MNRIEKLIEELCPDGVEFKTLGEIGTVCMCKRIVKSETSSSGDIPFFKIGTFGGTADAYISKDLYDKYIEKYSFPKKGEILISASGTIGRRVIYDGKPAYFQDSNIVWIHNNERYVLNKFLYYLYEIIEWKTEGGTIKRLYNNLITSVQVPIPPLTVQEEIVKILDAFTNYQAELQAELEARKEQYEYYRNQLLTFDKDDEKVKWKKIGDLCTIKGRIGFRGYTKNDIVEESNGVISLSPANIVNNSIQYKKNTYISWDKYYESPEIMVHEYDIVFCKTGSTIGKVAIIKNLPKETTINPQLVVLKEIKCNPCYLSYVMSCNSFQSQVQKIKGVGSVPTISQKDFSSLSVPIPPISEQERIVAILDKFESLVNDLTNGLPAEIAAVQEQYEYYRNKLLTFKPKEVC